MLYVDRPASRESVISIRSWSTSRAREPKPTAIDFLTGHKRDKERSPQSPDRQVAPV